LGLYKEKPSAKSAFFLHFHSLLNVNRIILHFVSDGPKGGLYKEKPSAKSALFLHFHSLLKACYQRFWKCKKPVISDWLFLVDRNIELSNLIWEGLLIITSLNEQTHVQFSRFEF
jgi:hypothetical protein